MTSLVTGCAGFIGSHLTESLLADGEDVIGIDCFNDNYPREQKIRNLDRFAHRESFTFLSSDIVETDLREAVDASKVVFHLAAEPGVRPSWDQRFETYLHHNVLGTQHLLNAVRHSPETRVVYASSSSVYGQAETFPTPESARPRPMSPYGVTKLTAEHLCDLYAANFGLSTVALRYFSVYGPRQRPDMAFHRFFRAALEGTAIEVYGDGSQTRDFTFVGDVVAATKAAAQRPEAVGGVFNIGAGSRVTLNETLRLVGELAGRPLDVSHLERAHGDVRDTGADGTRAREELGFEPATGLEEGLAAELEWLREEIEGRVPPRASLGQAPSDPS